MIEDSISDFVFWLCIEFPSADESQLIMQKFQALCSAVGFPMDYFCIVLTARHMFRFVLNA